MEASWTDDLDGDRSWCSSHNVGAIGQPKKGLTNKVDPCRNGARQSIPFHRAAGAGKKAAVPLDGCDELAGPDRHSPVMAAALGLQL
jgi:hypothetical protein